MRLYLAVAVLVLAFVAYSEAQEQTFEERMAKVAELGKAMVNKAGAALEGIQNSPFAQNAKNWLDEQISKLKEKIQEISQQ